MFVLLFIISSVKTQNQTHDNKQKQEVRIVLFVFQLHCSYTEVFLF